MLKRFWRIVFGLTIVLTFFVGSQANIGAVNVDHPQWKPTGEQYTPRTDGEYVVWLDGRNVSTLGTFEIYGAPVTGGDEFPIATGPHDRLYPDVDSGIVVWVEEDLGCEGCGGDIGGLNLATGERFIVTANPLKETRPTLSGSIVVWVEVDADERERIYWCDISTNDEPTLISTAPVGWRIDLPAMDGDRIVWSESRASGPGQSEFRLLTFEIGTGTIQEIDSGSVTSSSAGLTDDYDIAGDLVTWAVDRRLYVLDFATDEEPHLLANSGSCPTTDGRYIFWEDFRNYVDTAREPIELWGYDLWAGSNFPIARAEGENHEYPHTANNVLVWQATTTGNRDVFADNIHNVVPTMPTPQRVGADPETYVYFQETGHALETEFKDFWEQSGGLPVFGYPMTEVFDEFNADTGEVYRVQYLERQRFELHPDLAGSPYEVLIGRMGVTAAEQRGYLDPEGTPTEPFQPLPDTSNGDGCFYFNETGHTLCGRFLDYWQGSGLEFGDEGISFRESLALFGYPISEEFIDSETGFVTQYFERAIFEYHPENDGTQYEVLLRRLGAEELEARDWCAEHIPGCS